MSGDNHNQGEKLQPSRADIYGDGWAAAALGSMGGDPVVVSSDQLDLDLPREGGCGYTLIDLDGEEYPCDRAGVSWRWYQGHEHEDALDRACIIHENPGGIRMAALVAEVCRLRAEQDKVRAFAHLLIENGRENPDTGDAWDDATFSRTWEVGSDLFRIFNGGSPKYVDGP